ncbi:hypothetical protein LOD99_11998 [Oopsacas minuta]|uniref:Uncharacterized protein n=1 Tax=Oopsacas minuta TaxID=111878 RepID=A0AAV7JID0_9METZ|nr:hypothetical protein LOD99_11998 [Oopsacas minuta]
MDGTPLKALLLWKYVYNLSPSLTGVQDLTILLCPKPPKAKNRKHLKVLTRSGYIAKFRIPNLCYYSQIHEKREIHIPTGGILYLLLERMCWESFPLRRKVVSWIHTSRVLWLDALLSMSSPYLNRLEVVTKVAVGTAMSDDAKQLRQRSDCEVSPDANL